jgi:hypothetical protein
MLREVRKVHGRIRFTVRGMLIAVVIFAILFSFHKSWHAYLVYRWTHNNSSFKVLISDLTPGASLASVVSCVGSPNATVSDEMVKKHIGTNMYGSDFEPKDQFLGYEQVGLDGYQFLIVFQLRNERVIGTYDFHPTLGLRYRAAYQQGEED